MGTEHSKNPRHSEVSRRSRRSSNQSNESSLILSAHSLDLIYIDDYFDNERYLKLVEKRLAEKKKAKRAKTANKKSRSLPLKSVSSNGKRNSKSTPIISKPNQSKTKTTSKTRPVNTAPSKSVKILVPPSTKSVPSSSVSTGNLPSRSSTTTKGKAGSSVNLSQNVSWHAGVSTGPRSRNTQVSQSPALGTGRLQSRQVSKPTSPANKSEQTFRPRSILTNSIFQTKANDSGRLRSQRSFIKSSNIPQKTKSLARGWSPASASAIDATNPVSEAVPIERDPDTTIAQTGGGEGQSFVEANGDQNVTRPSSPPPEERPTKKKLVVRGLRNFVNSRRRDSSMSSSIDDHLYPRNYEGRGDSGGSFPPLWKREFPSKSKFHPDNYIYDWPEGPNAPTRPFSAMAKCKKHGGRCNDCGLFTCDLCQPCRKCENDCVCPVSRGNAVCNNPYSQTGAYEEVFGGDGWTKARKVLCDLTENDKRHPVGGNASKKAHQLNENWAKSNFYKPQIDVLNPYNICTNEAHPPGMALGPPPPVPFQYPMCPPPMYPPMPMQFMPMMAMPPPMMPFYPPPPPCYDPCYAMPPPPCPYSSTDSFMPNY